MKRVRTLLTSKLAVIIFLIILFIYIDMRIRLFMISPKYENVEYCFSDILCLIQKYAIWVYIPFSQLIIIVRIRGLLSINRLIRIQSLKRLWIQLSRHIFYISLIFAGFMVIVACVLGWRFARCFECNWINQNSLAFAMVQRASAFNISVWNMIVIYMFLEFIEIFIIGLFITILWWWLGSPVYGFMLVIVVMVLEMGISPAILDLFFCKISLDVSLLYLNGINLWNQILYPILLTVMIYCSGLFGMRRRDILSHSSHFDI